MKEKPDRKGPSPVPPGVMDAVLNSLESQLEPLRRMYREVWRDSLTSPSGQHLNVKVPTTFPTEDTYLNNRSTRDALAEVFEKIQQADALTRSARGMVSNRHEGFDPKRKHKAEGSSLTEQEMADMEGRARAKPSRRWERTG